MLLCHKKGNETDDDGSDGPHRIPRLWVIIGNGEANSGVLLESTRFGNQHNSRWLPWILERELDLAKVIAVFVVGIGEAMDHEVPFIYVVRIWSRDKIVLCNLAIRVFFNLFLIVFGESTELFLQSYSAG